MDKVYNLSCKQCGDTVIRMRRIKDPTCFRCYTKNQKEYRKNLPIEKKREYASKFKTVNGKKYYIPRPPRIKKEKVIEVDHFKYWRELRRLSGEEKRLLKNNCG